MHPAHGQMCVSYSFPRAGTTSIQLAPHSPCPCCAHVVQQTQGGAGAAWATAPAGDGATDSGSQLRMPASDGSKSGPWHRSCPDHR
eukprot:scaffold108266_cov22-Tisochrysis_lutea.AAC.1